MRRPRSLRKDERAASPAISTVILTAAGIVMILIAMSYANNILSLKMAQNEFSTNKQFMQTTGQQLDDIAWTVGRTQTVSFSSRYGTVKFQDSALNYTFRVHSSAGWENMTISGGSLTNNGIRYSVRIKGQFADVETLKNIVVHASGGAFIKLTDLANVEASHKEQESFARLDGKNVITLNVVKKSGANLLDASDKIKEIVKNELIGHEFPKGMDITITGDQSRFTRNTLDELNNTIIIGFILVTIVLMFFMGFTNAFFVGLSVPLSIFVAYLILPGLGFTMNMIVMFGFIFVIFQSFHVILPLFSS